MKKTNEENTDWLSVAAASGLDEAEAARQRREADLADSGEALLRSFARLRATYSAAMNRLQRDG